MAYKLYAFTFRVINVVVVVMFVCLFVILFIYLFYLFIIVIFNCSIYAAINLFLISILSIL